MPVRAIEVALPLPLQSSFTYLVPDGAPVPDRGVRVMAPFGPRRVIGMVTGRAAGVSGRALKPLLAVLDETPLVPAPLLDLAEWMAGHYLSPPGECYRLVLPPAGIAASRAVARLMGEPTGPDPVADALRAGPLRVSTLARRLGRDPAGRLARLRREGVVVIEQELVRRGFRETQVASIASEAARPRGPAQSEVLRRLREAGGPARVSEIVRGRPSLRSALRRLAVAGAVRIAEEREARTPATMAGGNATTHVLTSDQEKALAPILEAVEARRFAPFLLHGVTASGKTEVYFRAIERTLETARGALMLVPEIALTPLLVRAAVARFGQTVSVLHSELSAGERHDQWWRIREGEARVVVGARSAVFAPVGDLGLVVVDEEHEASYKQEESPRYQARDVALMRGRLEGAAVVLGSATPSMESYANARKGKYRRLALPLRVGERALPRVTVVDRRELLKAGLDPILSPALLAALAERVSRGEQSLLLLNRRGWATSLVCRECGLSATCPNCSVALTLHQGGRRALCHYCGHAAPAARSCEVCRGEYLRLTGFGTERVVEAVQAALPQARVDRLDRDLASRRGQVERVLADFEDGRTDVLVGTQMIAKGHDFPRVTLVGVIDADVGLGLPDFRSAERTFQLLTQVAGRAGRGDRAGEVILQSHLPSHYALELACNQDYEAFFEREMEFRRTMGYPPAAALINLVFHAREAAAAGREAEAVARSLRAGAPGRYRVLGPARAPLGRLRQEHRFQVLLKGSRPAMRECVRDALVSRYGATRWPGVAVDVDPVSVM